MGRLDKTKINMKTMKNKKLLLYVFVLISFTQFIHAQVPTYVPTNGLVGYWPFKGNANDATTNGNNGFVNGATLTADKNGNSNSAYSFNGTSNNIGLAQPFLGGVQVNSFTFYTRFKSIGSPANGSAYNIWGKTFFWGEVNFGIAPDNTIYIIWANSNGGNTYTHVQTNTSITPNTWVDALITFENSQVKIYFNGVLQATTDYYGTNSLANFAQDANSSKIGSRISSGQTGGYFNGIIDDMSVWNRALTQQEITNLYNSCTTAAPTVAANQTFCTAARVANLTATGTDVKWYASANESIALLPSTTLTSGTYYATQTINGCESTRTAVAVAVNDAQITASATSVCSGKAVLITASANSANSTGSNTLPTNLQNGLVGYWPFNGNANDVSRNGNNGTVNGAMLTSDRFGNSNGAYSFDGINSYIIANNTPNILTSNYSVSIWFNSTISLCSNNVMLRSGNASNCGWQGFSVGPAGPNNFGLIDVGNNNYAFVSNYNCNNVSSNEWHNLVYTRQNMYSKQYIDGILVSSNSSSHYDVASNCPIFFGSNHLDQNGNSWNVFNGKLDDIAIYNRALSSSEIQQLYTQEQTTYLWSTGETTATINPTPTATTTYWCDITVNGLTCRKEMTISVIPNTAPAAAANQTYCTATTVSNLVAIGTDIKWYASATDMTALTPSTTITSGTYYASQTINGCESTRTAVTVAVNFAQITASATSICNGESTLLSLNSTSISNCYSSTNIIRNVPSQYATIQQAIDASNNGDTILLEPGTYFVNNLTFFNKTVHLISSGNQNNTFIDGNNSNRLLTVSNDELCEQLIKGITFRNGHALNNSGYVVAIQTGRTRFKSCNFQNCGGNTGNTLFRGSGISTSTFEDCIVRNNSAENYAGLGYATVIRCVVYSNSGWNNTSPIVSCNVLNSTVYGNGGGANNPWTTGGISWSTVKNSIVWGNGGAGQIYNCSSVTYSVISGGYPGAGNLSSNPLFVNPSATNFNLTSNSPAINSADPDLNSNGQTFSVDNQDQDPDGTRMDIGAIFYSTGPSINPYYTNSNILWSTGETTATINPTPTATTTYWCDITANGVTCRKEITITVNPTTAPTAAVNQTFCTAATIANLTATGTDVKWYTTATDVTALAPSTILTSGTYYASQTINGCESTRTAVTVAVNFAQITASATTVCSGTAVTITASANSANTAGSNTLPTNLQNGLVGYWPFNGNANDASGNGNNGTVNGATLTTDRFGNSNSAYLFNRDELDNIEITVNNLPINNDSKTISVWTKWDPVQIQNAAHIINYGAPFGETGTAFGLMVYQGNNWYNYSHINDLNSNALADSNWTSLVTTYENGQRKIFVNGIIANSDNILLNTKLTNLLVGKAVYLASGSTNYFNGKIDDIGVWNRSLTPQEISQLYTQGQTTYLWSSGDTTPTINPTPTATTTYWCDITANGVTCRKEMTITVIPTTAPTAAANQTFCTATTVANLTATGTDVKWYASATDTTALAPSTTLTSGTYYASQTINGCESTRTAVTVAVNDAQITASATTVCSGTAVSITASSTVAGNSSLPANLQNGLVGYWPFNGNANDASGNGNNGTVNGATLTTDRFGNSNGAYSFNGVNNNINLSPINFTGNNISISTWVNPTSLTSNRNHVLIRQQSNVGLDYLLSFQEYGNIMSFGLTTSNNGYTELDVPIIPSNNSNSWHNFIAVYNGNNRFLYKDGVLIGSDFVSGNIIFSSNKCSIGSASESFEEFFNGKIDELEIYNRALSPAEIQQIYTQDQTTYLWSTGETTANINPTPTATTTYWCDVTANGVTCRKEMTITIPTITSHPSNANLCATVGASTSISIQDNIPNANYTWQYRVVTAANPNPTWTNISSSNASNVYANYTTATLTITKTTTLPAIGTQYRVVVAGNCGISVSNPANLTIISTIKAGTIVSAATVCLGGNITLTLSAFTGTSFQWQSAPISTTTAPGVFTDIPGATSTSYTISSATADINKSYRVVVANSCYGTSAISPIKTIKVDPSSIGGTVKGGGTVCSLGGGTLSLTGYVGKIQWQYSTDGGATYVNAPSATVGSSSNFTTTSATSIAATYLVANVSSNTLFRALVTNGVCSSSASNAVEFVLGTQAAAGTISTQASTICAASGTTLTLSGNLGSIVWQKSTNWTAATPTWAAVTTSVTPTLNTGALSATTAFRAKVTIGLCSTVYTDVTVITVSPTAKGGTVAVNVAGTDVCSGSSKAMKVTGNVGTIQWQMSTTSATAGFVDVAGATTTPYTFTNITQPTWFRVVARSGVCTTTSASNAIGITVTTIPAVAGTISGVNSVCTATGSTLSLAGSTGTIMWQKAVAPFTTWSAVTGATTSSLATGNLTATTAYRAILTSGTCKAMTDAYTVTVSPAARAAAISGNAVVKTLATAICTSTTAPLTLATGSIGTIEWQYYFAGSSATSVTNTSVVTWTPIVGATSAVYNASSNQAGNVWFRIKFTSGPCSLNAFSTPINVWFKDCSIAKIETQDELVKTTFAVVAYPNPYSKSFNLSLTTSSEDKVGVMVYDMTGKLIEQHEVRLSEVSALHVGDRYPSGVYNVIVTQGQEYKTLRVVKR